MLHHARAVILVVLVQACGANGSAPDGGGSTFGDGSTSGDASPLDPDGSSPGSADILVPAQGALLGHFYGRGSLAETDARIGRKPAVHLSYFGWTDDWPADLAADFADDRIPLVNWEPMTDGRPVDFEAIVRGDFDTMVSARARAAKRVARKFFLDFAAEMNGDEGWGDHVPARYIAAYRHIHDLFAAAGATNVVWIWAPNVTDVPGGPATLEYYPGDAYVDWTGVDGYNWGASDPDFEWQTFREVFADIYPTLATKAKPIFIGEMASDEVGGSKADWIGAIVDTLKIDYPLIKGVVWFDIEKERHWQIDSSAAASAAYRQMASDPFMNP